MTAESESATNAASESTPYDFAAIEPKWQEIWEESKKFSPADDDPRPAYYNLSMFPYPSGALHCGHIKNYTLPDTIARFRTAKGYAVMQPMGWDAFGLPAENAAIKSGIHPAISTFQHIERMTAQFKQMGYALDWSREFFTCKPDYYKWTQWLFVQMMKLKGKSGEPLAYRKKSRVNWCPNDKTVLANEQVVTCNRDGKEYQGCFRCETKVEQRDLEQWCFRITDYADELLDCLNDLEGSWPDSVIAQQREWIGRSYGTDIVFKAELPNVGGTGIPACADQPESVDIPVFTTRADTLFGVTFLAIAPEHPLVRQIIESADKGAEIQAFVSEVLAMDAEERASITEKKGVDTGVRAVHPFTGEEVPVFVGNYVLMYGTGAVMAVPAHDQRDFEFAKTYGLPITHVVTLAEGAEVSEEEQEEFDRCKAGECAFTGRGVMHDSGEFSGKSSDEGIAAIQEALSAMGLGGKTTNYRIRDWGISRQRYWGCPIPVIHCDDCGIVPVPEDQLPVILPEDVEFVPTGRSPLETHPEFVKATCPTCGSDKARRDTDTMDTFVDSSWYFLRFCDPHNENALVDRAKADHWMPVEQYIGGAEHAILHLIYARFINKVMRDLGLTAADEPFARLFTQGMVLKESVRVRSENYRYVTTEELDEGLKSGAFKEDDLLRRVEKMSKSQLNVVDPEYIVKQYGADTLRAYVLFIGPAAQDAEWKDSGVVGVHKFLHRWWQEVQGWSEFLSGESVDDVSACSKVGKELRRLSHLYIQKTEKDYAGEFGFNTCISKAMELINYLREQDPSLVENPADRFAVREALETLALCMAPITPHICEEMWQVLGHEQGILDTPWPTFREELTAQDEIQVAVQVNGKVRDQLLISAEASKDDYEKAALELPGVQRNVEGKTVRKVIVVPGKIVNIVAN